ncbi:VOC family protein [Cellulosimicrobium arenosum]|uniref:VOC family protein n=1 Tax=Cellulosimicrobium arenosum TaxID=2708133 RepID=A0A927IZL5_9MICO|nr:VOC family protein [Cellulosimicrobium arenosum]MBD8078502.1 VOC family protein [Cellulosimicrobium arenosum]
MRIASQVVVLDAADIATESAFWASVLGGEVDASDDWHTVSVDGHARLAVQLAPDHVPPRWPDGEPQQIHLDLWIENPEEAHNEVVALGARVLEAEIDPDAPDAFHVYADPAGHPFCLCWTKGA